ncbi:RloB family protein [Streptosporangium sp. NPDC005286]|uniref:RloB family protein n=1 Tax=Streptosporangium sp. NPDC005286 TaxID=3154463 RepID=UPI0033B026A2
MKISTETRMGRNRRNPREERSSFLILCEGPTEKGYFTGMRSRRGPQLDVDIPKGDHISAVREAVSRVSAEYDAVWCVLDTELDKTLTASMLRAAQGSSVELGLSTPSFEFWPILHHAKYTKPFQSADDAKKMLKKISPFWSEGNTRFSDFADKVDSAYARAQQISPDGKNPMLNPSTSVWRLVARIQGRPEATGRSTGAGRS